VDKKIKIHKTYIILTCSVTKRSQNCWRIVSLHKIGTKCRNLDFPRIFPGKNGFAEVSKNLTVYIFHEVFNWSLLSPPFVSIECSQNQIAWF